jgi:cytochrome P450
MSVTLEESSSTSTTEQELEPRETIIKAVAANMYGAGADTTVSALGTFILGMLVNPDAQRTAQAELDAVVGKGQLPDFTDEPSLPYTTAIVKEALRWKNVTPIGSSLLLYASRSWFTCPSQLYRIF